MAPSLPMFLMRTITTDDDPDKHTYSNLVPHNDTVELYSTFQSHSPREQGRNGVVIVYQEAVLEHLVWDSDWMVCTTWVSRVPSHEALLRRIYSHMGSASARLRRKAMEWDTKYYKCDEVE